GISQRRMPGTRRASAHRSRLRTERGSGQPAGQPLREERGGEGWECAALAQVGLDYDDEAVSRRVRPHALGRALCRRVRHLELRDVLPGVVRVARLPLVTDPTFGMVYDLSL